MRKTALAALLLLATACGSPLTPREGKDLRILIPQAEEQCKAQPELDWCNGR